MQRGNSSGNRGPPTMVDVNFGLRLDDPLAEMPIEVETTTNTPTLRAATAVDVLSSDDNHRSFSGTTSANRQHNIFETSKTDTGQTIREDETSSPHDIDGVIYSFNEELERLERSFNELASSQRSLRQSARTPIEEASRENRENNSLRGNIATPPRRGASSYSNDRLSQSTAIDPPSASRTTPLRMSMSSTPQRASSTFSRSRATYGIADSGRSNKSYGIAPEPVETPIQPKEPNRSSSQTRNSTHRSSMDVQDWESTLDRMKERLSQQEQRILELERENRDLRSALEESVGRRQPPSPSQPYTSYATRRPLYNRQQSEDLASRGMTFRSTQLSTPPHDSGYFQDMMDDYDSSKRRVDVILEDDQEFTPGTKFVAELARLMRMENGHHAPLSVILDKHWDRLKHHMQYA
ncbi:hypothetical protein IV203_012073 [Nitzschia inconspicua]|uniref:Uncharacterized protein n=1 Tax=Nitzschia inconspicua TaxID=303405 RepID=A0A9K3KTW5_9STRA|nr:hypothetical protein IV203_012073 [Nitzschia inconspicua]